MSASIPHWSAEFLDVGYRAGGGEPGGKFHDCWTFFRWVQKARFGRDLPPHATPPNLVAIAKAMPVWIAEFGWRPVEKPSEGDAVFMSVLRHPTHVGIVVRAKPSFAVLHCPEGGAALHDKFHLRCAGWRLRGYFRPGS